MKLSKLIILTTLLLLLASCQAESAKEAISEKQYDILNEEGKILPESDQFPRLIFQDPASYPTPGVLHEIILAEKDGNKILFAIFNSERDSRGYYEKLYQEIRLQGEIRIDQGELARRRLSVEAEVLYDLHLQANIVYLYVGKPEEFFLPAPLTQE